MKDLSEEEMRSSRSQFSLSHTVAHCLTQLFADQEHNFNDEIVKGLSFEELIGTLLLAEDSTKLCDE